MAQRHPDTLFIGMDSEPVCVVHAAQLVLDLGLKNALVIPGDAANLAGILQRHPDTLFIGMDSEPVCVVHAAQLVLDLGLKNALVIPGDAANLAGIFAPGELKTRWSFPAMPPTSPESLRPANSRASPSTSPRPIPSAAMRDFA